MIVAKHCVRLGLLVFAEQPGKDSTTAKIII
jgi:hypothetical protein